MIRLTTREGKTVIAVGLTKELVDKEILRHKGKSYVFVGKLKGDWVFHEATIGDIGEATDVLTRLAKARETFCYSSPGSTEEFTAYLQGFDSAAAIIKESLP